MTGGKKPAALQVWVQALLAQRLELLEYLKEEACLPCGEGKKYDENCEDETLLELILKQLGALQGPLEMSARVCARLVEKMGDGLEEEVLALLVWNDDLESALIGVAKFFAWIEKGLQDVERMEEWRTFYKTERFTQQERDWLVYCDHTELPSGTMEFANQSLRRSIERLRKANTVPLDSSGAWSPFISVFLLVVGLIVGRILAFRSWSAQGTGTTVSTEPVSFSLRGPWADTCDIAFNWTRKAEAGGESGEDFRKFRFERARNSACTYGVIAMGFHLTGHKAVDEAKLIFQGIGQCTGKVDVAVSEEDLKEENAKWNGWGIWPVCRNGSTWSCTGGPIEKMHQNEHYAHLDVPEWHGGGCKCTTGCAGYGVEYTTWWAVTSTAAMTGGRKPAALQTWVQALLAQRHELLEYLREEVGLLYGEVEKYDEGSEDETLLKLILKQLGALQGPLEESSRVCARLLEKMEAGLEEEVLALLAWNVDLEIALGEVASFFAWIEKGAEDPARLEEWRTFNKTERFTQEEKDWLIFSEYTRPPSQILDFANQPLTLSIERLEMANTGPSETSGPWCCTVAFILLMGLVLVLAFRSCFAQGSGMSVPEEPASSTTKPGSVAFDLIEAFGQRGDVSTSCSRARSVQSPSRPLILQTPCSFDCGSFQVQHAAMDFYLNKHREVQSVTVLNSVTSGPWADTCDIAFSWTRKAEVGGESGEDFRKFRFERAPDSACTYGVSAMGFHLTGHKAVDETKLIFQGIGQCTGQIDVAVAEEELGEGAAEWNGRGMWPICRNGTAWSCTGGGVEKMHENEHYAHLDVPEWHGAGCKCTTGCAEQWAEHEAKVF
ncbi:hypothetical protein KFL_003570100 [Klebsormidium nitens]|uniref:DUF7074 domain-containing protein n=1 Tax=Klebsormidium nitens TaxID=105231 RepID=A0A1Y1IEJ3_KLENI|nr:hypothetical protein KFL_003570100 [Klebsormidium nitens]|eukprot:GAQ87501.1 hypothetical protein KFL_003570100 [Klebsormidium nitens]